MIFTGQSDLTIDAKQRLAIPAKYRSLLKPDRDGTAWYCVPWGEGKLALYTERRFEEIVEGRDLTLTPDETESTMDSAFFGMCERIEPDAAGRIVIPKRHQEMANLKEDVVVVGCGKYLEIWDRERWNERFEQNFRKLPTIVNEHKQRGAKSQGPGNGVAN